MNISGVFLLVPSTVQRHLDLLQLLAPVLSQESKTTNFDPFSVSFTYGIYNQTISCFLLPVQSIVPYCILYLFFINMVL